MDKEKDCKAMKVRLTIEVEITSPGPSMQVKSQVRKTFNDQAEKAAHYFVSNVRDALKDGCTKLDYVAVEWDIDKETLTQR